MTAQKTVDWLVQEISDLLDVSNVGLYEFMEFLNDPEHPMPLDERTEIARQALERILRAKGVEMKRMRWPDSDSRGAVSLAGLPPDPWQPPDENGDYIALDRIEP